MPYSAEQLRKIHTFKDLLHYLEEKLDWPLQEYQFDELTFEYQPEELGLKEEDAAKVRTIHQLRPLQHGQPWGIFFVEFENKRLPVVVLRRILSHLVVKKRASANKAGEAAWHAEDLLFITTFGEDDSIQREIAFAHFHQSAGDLPTLHVLGWDGGDTPLKLAHLDSDLQKHLRWPDNAADHLAWRQQWAMPFRHRIGHVIRTADALAEVLATLARSINEKATRMLAVESENGPLRMLYKAFQTALIHDLTEENFADTYAQTITYGLLTAAISRTDWSEGRHGTFIIAENVTDMVPITNPFLKEMLQTFLKIGGRKGGIDFDELGIQDVVELLRGDETDLPEILRDFGNRTPGEDPVIHFYEHFLSAYNKKLKIQRGVFYTPQPVVSYIIRSVHELLQTEFGLEDGLASTITWGEMIALHPDMKLPILTPKNPSKPGSKDILISPESPFVMILDIATGTGTFLVEIIDVIYKTMKAKWQKQGKREQEIVTLWNEYVPKHLLPRLYGYELMMAPYAIAHMKIGLKLSETGYKFMSDERVRVYLTNTLEPASDTQSRLVGIVPALAHEAESVNDVKRNVRFMIVVGNPPYSGESANKGEWIMKLMEDYKKEPGGIEKLNERNPKWINDDYVKFLHNGQHFIENNGIGILAYINPHGFLDNPTFRGMRWNLLKTYDKIYTIDLHGNAKKKETSPDGSPDINVFDIEQGVSINIFVKTDKKKANDLGQFFHYDLFGKRELKYDFLIAYSLESIAYKEIPNKPPMYFMVQKDFTSESQYNQYLSINDLFPQTVVGIATAKDAILINENANELQANVKSFFQVEPDKDKVRQIAYRPFDIRKIYYDTKLVERAREKIMQHFIKGENVGLISNKQIRTAHVFHHWVTKTLTDLHITETANANPYIFPLYLYPETNIQQTIGQNTERKPNLNTEIVKQLAEKLGLTFTNEKENTKDTFAPIDILDYIYAVLHSPTYRQKYKEFLKIDFPKVPYPKDSEIFKHLVKLGGEIRQIHLLESPIVEKYITQYPIDGSNVVDKAKYQNGNVVINDTQYFTNVPEVVWNFHIGGYQVCEKWLKDRKGRTLFADDITHYQRIVVALSETIRIMGEIDQVIDEHGGWPIT